MSTRAGIVLQARCASTRLPNKALAPIGPRTVIERCLRRLAAGGAADVVLATTTNAEDDALEAIAQDMGVPVFRGSEQDVLGRYVDAAARFGFDVVVRATGDNPAVDIDAAGRLLDLLASSGADYACEHGLPYGAAVEAVTTAALRRAADCAREPADREHVTLYVKQRPRAFTIARTAAPAALRRPDLRVTVDTPEDLGSLRALFARVDDDEPSLRALIHAAGLEGRQEDSCRQ